MYIKCYEEFNGTILDKSVYINWSNSRGNTSDFSNIEFIRLYRAEGSVVNRNKLPKSTRSSSGTWFTPNLKEATRYSEMSTNRRIYKLDIPLVLYNNLSKLNKGGISQGEIKLPLDLSILKTPLEP